MQSFFNKLLSRNLFVYVFLFCIAFLAYVAVLHGPFFFDDNIFIEHNASVQHFDIARIYTHSTTFDSGISGDNFYRPNQQMVFALLIKIFGATPWIFHFVSIFFHSINGFLIFILFIYVGIKRPYALLGALIFLLHPIQTQAVAYISGLSEPLVTMSVLGVVILYIRQIKVAVKSREIVIMFALTIISFFSKENALMLVGFLLLVGLYLYKQGSVQNRRVAVWLWTGVTALSLIYLSLRLTVFNFTAGLTGGFGIAVVPNVYTESLSVRLITFISTLWQYCKMIVVPIHLHYETPYVAYQSPISFEGIFGIFIIVIGLYFVYRSLVYGKGIFFFGFTWFFTAFIPVSGIVPTNAIYLEHWLYMPIIGMIFLCVYGLQKIEDRNHLFLYVVCIVLCIYGVIDIDRNIEWADPIRFYQNELLYTQEASRVYANLGMEMADRGNCQDAVGYYKHAILVNDQYPQTHYNFARCLETMGDMKNAVVEYNNSLRIDPTFEYSIQRLKTLRVGMLGQ